jgi:Ca2+:H+ antiporter
MNILLVFLPIGIVGGVLGWADIRVFALNFLAVIPLASLIAFSTRELSGSAGLFVGRLLKATLSNIFEVIVRVQTLFSSYFVFAFADSIYLI